MPFFAVRAYSVAMSAVEELPYWVKFETGRDDEQVLTHSALLNILEQERAALESDSHCVLTHE